MKENTLVIMAAGLGSRYQGGIKQLDPIGPNGEIIMDYSIYDAYKAGFRRVILIIREEFRNNIDEHFKGRLPDDLSLEYVYQKLEDIPSPYAFEERTKPWGTGQAILVCKEKIKGPFAVINADDYYGCDAFHKVYDYMISHDDFCMAGYFLENTLSVHGTVNRGICKVENMQLKEIIEVFKIAATDGIATGVTKDGELYQIDSDSYCSMNFFGFTPKLFEELETRFVKFLEEIEDPMQEEFLLPTILGELLKEEKISIQVLPTKDKWFGMTYQEDKKEAIHKINTLIEDGIYPNILWER